MGPMKTQFLRTALSPLALAFILSAPAHAPAQASASGQERSRPQSPPLAQTIPDAADTPYPGGPISLDIDATDVTRGVYRVAETIPVAPGTTTLILELPRWLPGNHAPSGTADQLVDVRFTAQGQPLKWHRDPVEVFAFHLDLPANTSAVTAHFVHTSPLQSSEGRITMTPDMLNLQWDRMSLYPAGHYVRQIRIAPKVTFPAGWQVASALDGLVMDGASAHWAETDYETLIDSPVMAGRYVRRFDLGGHVTMNVLADRSEQLALPPQGLAAYRALVTQAQLAFGAHHYDHYDFLLALSDKLGGIGLEHHRSSENSMDPRAFTDWDAMDWNHNVIAHEYSHSWDGKFRRPARLWTPDYRAPMQGDLLWVYEGQTQFWGYVLAARSGVQSKDMILGNIASNAGQFTQWPGRQWRSVEDTGMDPVLSGRRPKPYASLDRNEDYYTEGMLTWLEADQIIRQGTGGKRGLDDFAHAFFGIRDGDWGEVPYEFADVVAALNAVYPYDWAEFLNRRINTPGQPAPLGGIEKAGYRLVWKTQPNPYDKGRMTASKGLSLIHSLGLTLDKDGRVTSCLWDSPGFNAGIVTGAKILAANGIAYEPDALRQAITAASGTSAPVDLIVQRGDRVQAVSIPYHGGLRYPWLEKIGDAKTPAGLDLLLSPRRP